MEEWEFVKLSQIFIGDKLKSQWLRPKDSPLRKYFIDQGISEVDEMFEVVLGSLYGYLN